jgi:hypothetical protein
VSSDFELCSGLEYDSFMPFQGGCQHKSNSFLNLNHVHDLNQTAFSLFNGSLKSASHPNLPQNTCSSRSGCNDPLRALRDLRGEAGAPRHRADARPAPTFLKHILFPIDLFGNRQYIFDDYKISVGAGLASARSYQPRFVLTLQSAFAYGGTFSPYCRTDCNKIL